MLSVSIEIYSEKCDMTFSVADENPKKQGWHDTTRHELNEKTLLGSKICKSIILFQDIGRNTFFVYTFSSFLPAHFSWKHPLLLPP